MAMDCTYRLRIPHTSGQLAAVATRIAEHGGLIGDVKTISVARHEALREITVELRDKPHAEELAVGAGRAARASRSRGSTTARSSPTTAASSTSCPPRRALQPGRARRLHARRGARVAPRSPSTRSSPGASR